MFVVVRHVDAAFLSRPDLQIAVHIAVFLDFRRYNDSVDRLDPCLVAVQPHEKAKTKGENRDVR